MTFLLPVCDRNKTCITDISNVKKTLHKAFTLIRYVQRLLLCRYWYHDTIIIQIDDMYLPAGDGDKTRGHVNDVYFQTAAYTGVRYSTPASKETVPLVSFSVYDESIL